MSPCQCRELPSGRSLNLETRTGMNRPSPVAGRAVWSDGNCRCSGRLPGPTGLECENGPRAAGHHAMVPLNYDFSGTIRAHLGRRGATRKWSNPPGRRSPRMRIEELVERFGGQLDGDGSVEVTGIAGIETLWHQVVLNQPNVCVSLARAG